MSLFDVIKYPLSDPPTEAEVHNLPKEIYNAIAQVMYIKYVIPVNDWSRPINVTNIHYAHYSHESKLSFDVNLARKIILEWKDDNI